MSDSRNNNNGRHGLFAEIKRHPRVLVAVILFHLALAVMLSINLASDDAPPMPAAKKHDIINAVTVDAKRYDEKKKQEELKKKKALEAKKAAEKKRAEELKRKQELERKKAAQKKKEAEKKAADKKAAEEKRQKEIALAKKKEEEKKRQEAEKKRLEAEKKRKAEEERKRIEAEKKRKAEEERKRIEAEKKRKAEEERKRRAEEKAEMERALQEEENARIAAERAARLQTQREQYIIQIRDAVENNWLRPPGNVDGMSCEVFVTQTMRGDVMDVQLRSCTGDNDFQRSVERAVQKASPLPLPPSPDVYEREILFKFKPR